MENNKMIYLSRAVLSLTVAVLAFWQIPSALNMLLAESYRSDFTLYSTLADDFVSLGNYDGEMKYYSARGEQYTDQQFDSILPAFYVRQLVTDGRFPETIKGVDVTPQLLQQHNFNFRVKPSDINAPIIRLYSLLESMSKRVKLEMPDDVFRITDSGIEFVDMESNTIKAEKSEAFTSALLKKGFTFPAQRVAGNASARKDYDNGYLLIDAKGELYNLRMTVGRPYVRHIELKGNVTPKYVFVTEFSDRKSLGYMTDTENNMYVVESDNTIRAIVGYIYNPERDAITIMGNMFDWTVRVTTDEMDNYYAIDAESYDLLDRREHAFDGWSLPSVSFTSYDDKFVKLRF